MRTFIILLGLVCVANAGYILMRPMHKLVAFRPKPKYLPAPKVSMSKMLSFAKPEPTPPAGDEVDLTLKASMVIFKTGFFTQLPVYFRIDRNLLEHLVFVFHNT